MGRRRGAPAAANALAALLPRCPSALLPCFPVADATGGGEVLLCCAAADVTGTVCC